jgi:hypothetical protein
MMPLHHACKEGHTDVVSALKAAGVNVRDKTEVSITCGVGHDELYWALGWVQYINCGLHDCRDRTTVRHFTMLVPMATRR